MTYDPATLDTYSYDDDNRLVTVSGGASASYKYDDNGLRVQKSANGTTTLYIYSGSKDIAEYDNGAAPSSPSREFIYGNGELLAQVSGGATTYYQKDQLSVRMTTDPTETFLATKGIFRLARHGIPQTVRRNGCSRLTNTARRRAWNTLWPATMIRRRPRLAPPIR